MIEVTEGTGKARYGVKSLNDGSIMRSTIRPTAVILGKSSGKLFWRGTTIFARTAVERLLRFTISSMVLLEAKT